MRSFIAIATFIAISVVSFASCSNTSTSSEVPDDPEVTTITFDNMGATAYVTLSIDGDGASGTLNEENASISLQVGDRFRFNNTAGASNHPLDFTNSEGEKLFGQGNSDGLFDDNSEINLEKDGNALTFTLTEELADKLNGYICAFHPGMNGEISIEQ